MDKVSDLDVCPKCRGGNVVFTQVCTDGGYGVLCRDCHLTLDTRADTQEEAARDWNTRAPIPVTEGMIERAMDAYVGLLLRSAVTGDRTPVSTSDAMRAALSAALGGAPGTIEDCSNVARQALGSDQT